MAKRSKNRLSRPKDQASCIWGLIGLFGFRHNHSTRRLLANRGISSKLAVGSHSSIKRLLPDHIEITDNVLDAEIREIPRTAVFKPSVKELLEEEMLNEQGSRKQVHDSEFHNHLWRKKRFYSQSGNMDVSEGFSEINSGQVEPCKSQKRNRLNVFYLELLVKEFSQINMENENGIKSNLENSTAQGNGVEERLVAAVKMIIEQRLREAKNFDSESKNHNSNEFRNALQTLSSHRELLLKSIQDPNSSLMKRIQSLDVHMEKKQKTGSSICTKLSEEKLEGLTSDGLQNRRQYKLLGRRSKSLECVPSERDVELSSSREFVFLKSGPTGLQSSDTALNISTEITRNSDKVPNKGSIFHFSLAEIRRKFRNATGKDRSWVTSDSPMQKCSSKLQNQNESVDKCATAENFGWSSPNKNHFHSERFAKSSTNFKTDEQEGKLNESIQNPMLGIPDIYTEAKKCLSEMVNNEDMNAQPTSTNKQPKPLGRILSLSEYNSAPCCSPRKQGNEIFIMAQLNISPGEIGKNVDGLLQENNTDHSILVGKNNETQPHFLDEEGNCLCKPHRYDVKLYLEQEENECSSNCITNPKDQNSSSILIDYGGTMEPKPDEEGDVLSLYSESNSDAIQIDIQFKDLKEVDDEENSLECLEVPHCEIEPDLFGIEQILLSPTSSTERFSGTKESKYAEEAMSMNRPSPTSVLDPLLTDYDTIPETMFQLVVKQIEPRQIHFEEQYPPSDVEICSRFSHEGEESMFEYVEAVLLGSGLNWEEFLSRWLSHSEILDPSLFNEVELFSRRSYDDQKLLFDCANETLKKVCAGYFGCYAGKSPVRCNIRSVPKGMDLIHEVYKQIEHHLLQQPLHHSLDQLVKRDIVDCGKWLNILLDCILVGFNMEEDIFDELVDDIIQDITNDHTSDCDPVIR